MVFWKNPPDIWSKILICQAYNTRKEREKKNLLLMKDYWLIFVPQKRTNIGSRLVWHNIGNHEMCFSFTSGGKIDREPSIKHHLVWVIVAAEIPASSKDLHKTCKVPSFCFVLKSPFLRGNNWVNLIDHFLPRVKDPVISIFWVPKLITEKMWWTFWEKQTSLTFKKSVFIFFSSQTWGFSFGWLLLQKIQFSRRKKGNLDICNFKQKKVIFSLSQMNEEKKNQFVFMRDTFFVRFLSRPVIA